jgi:hypothetical protein
MRKKSAAKAEDRYEGRRENHNNHDFTDFPSDKIPKESRMAEMNRPDRNCAGESNRGLQQTRSSASYLVQRLEGG